MFYSVSWGVKEIALDFFFNWNEFYIAFINLTQCVFRFSLSSPGKGIEVATPECFTRLENIEPISDDMYTQPVILDESISFYWLLFAIVEIYAIILTPGLCKWSKNFNLF